MLRARKTFTYRHYDDAGKSHEDRYEEGSTWMTVGWREDWRQVARLDGGAHTRRWIPETMLGMFEDV